jgi:dUTP pyrophosphatase
MTNWINIKKLSSSATIPTRTNSNDAGLDLYSDESVTLLPNSSTLVNTGIAMAIPEGFAGLIWDRSGMAVKNSVHRFAGVIDSGYRGPIKVCLYNFSDTVVEVKRGHRIAQLIIQEIPNFVVQEVDDLDSTERGDGGFGSTGK